MFLEQRNAWQLGSDFGRSPTRIAVAAGLCVNRISGRARCIQVGPNPKVACQTDLDLGQT